MLWLSCSDALAASAWRRISAGSPTSVLVSPVTSRNAPTTMSDVWASGVLKLSDESVLIDPAKSFHA